MTALVDEGLYDDDELAAIERAGQATPRGAAPPVAGWRRTTASGSVLAAVLIGLRDVFDPPLDPPPVVVDHDGTGDDHGPVTVRLDPRSPAASVATVRRRRPPAPAP